MQSNYTQLSGEAQVKQKAFSRPMGNDISARQVLSQRIALSLDDLYFLKLKVWIFFFDSHFFFENVCFFALWVWYKAIISSVAARLHAQWKPFQTPSFVLFFTLVFFSG